nr:immunoglobulin heavy chain junction region [Mus musculus]
HILLCSKSLGRLCY